MGFIDFIDDIVQSRRISKANANRRGVTEYRPSQIGGFVEDDICRMNVVCSGDAADLRSEMIVSLCVSATNANIPVIVLHQGDDALVDQFRKVYRGCPDYIEVGPGAKHFDPVYGLNTNQIGKLIVDTAPQKYGLTCDGLAYIDTMTGYLSGKGKMITLNALNKCPHNNLPTYLSNAAQNHSLPAAVIQNLQISLAQGQREAHKVSAYLTELHNECIALLPQNKKDYVNCVDVFRCVNQKAILNMDIISDSNTLLLKIIAEQLKTLMRRRIPFVLILDNISLREENSMKAICSAKSNGFACVVAGDDVFSLCDGDEKLFGSVVGNSSKWFIFHHNSGMSAEKWSAAFSRYQKIDTTVNYGRGYGSNSGHMISFRGIGANYGSSRNSQQGYSYANKDEAVVRGNEILRLPVRGGFIYTASSREIAHVSEFLPQ